MTILSEGRCCLVRAAPDRRRRSWPPRRGPCRRGGSLALALSLVVVGHVPFELAEKLQHASLLPARDELLQRLRHRRLPRAFAAELKRPLDEFGINRELERH